jgi:hypothetical protein
MSQISKTIAKPKKPIPQLSSSDIPSHSPTPRHNRAVAHHGPTGKLSSFPRFKSSPTAEMKRLIEDWKSTELVGAEHLSSTVKITTSTSSLSTSSAPTSSTMHATTRRQSRVDIINDAPIINGAASPSLQRCKSSTTTELKRLIDEATCMDLRTQLEAAKATQDTLRQTIKDLEQQLSQRDATLRVRDETIAIGSETISKCKHMCDEVAAKALYWKQQHTIASDEVKALHAELKVHHRETVKKTSWEVACEADTEEHHDNAVHVFTPCGEMEEVPPPPVAAPILLSTRDHDHFEHMPGQLFDDEVDPEKQIFLLQADVVHLRQLLRVQEQLAKRKEKEFEHLIANHAKQRDVLEKQVLSLQTFSITSEANAMAVHDAKTRLNHVKQELNAIKSAFKMSLERCNAERDYMIQRRASQVEEARRKEDVAWRQKEGHSVPFNDVETRFHAAYMVHEICMIM